MVKVNNSEASVGGGGMYFDKECDCVFMLENIDVSKAVGDNPSVSLESVSVASSVPDQIGKKIRETYYLSGKSAGKFINICCGLGIYNLEQHKKDLKDGVFPELPIEECTGMLFGSRVRHQPMDEYNVNRITKRIEEHRAAGEHDKADKLQKHLDGGVGYLQIGGEKGFEYFALGDKEMDHVPYDATINTIANEKGEFTTRFGTLRKRGESSVPAAQPPKSSAKPPAGGSGKAANTKPANNFGGEFV